ncbi:MAG: AAA family ATPase, partial [Lachnospiraceae bacterium]|nr:AAA family ATPase [Lachnospiraceae bacterium]
MRRRIEDKLLEWKQREKRMPLLLYGARQVGKTYILTEFGRQYFENTVYINLETNLAVASYFTDDISPERIIRFLEATVNQEIVAGKTLIIFDEIQACERALTALKYFCELAPEYHIAAAGSLLGVAIHREQYSFPVGKVESNTLYPLNFQEFLWAMGEDRLAEEIHRCFVENEPMPDALHKKAIEKYRYYLIVGGMPASVQTFVNTGKLVLV